jgi:hypothetical protein
MPCDRRREPLLVHIHEPLAQEALHVLDIKVGLGAVRHAELVRAAEQLEWCECILSQRLLAAGFFLRRDHALQWDVDAHQVALHHLPRFCEPGFRGVVPLRPPQLDTEPQPGIQPAQPPEQSVSGEKTDVGVECPEVDNAKAIGCWRGHL